MNMGESEKRIDNLDCSLKIQKVEGEFQFAFKLSEPIVIPKDDMIHIFMEIKQIVHQHGENVLTMVEDTVEETIKMKLREGEAFFDDKIDDESIYESYEDPVALNPKGGVKEVKPDKAN